MDEHVSSFAIDVWFADGKPAGKLATHVAACARCSAYLVELDSLAAEKVALPSPPSRHPRAARSPLRLLAPAMTVLALAAAVLLYVSARSRTDNPDYVGVKGAPAVQALVRSNGTTRVWDGRSPVHAGDPIALHVACEHLEHVAVAAETPSGLVRLSDVPCPNPAATLPFTLVVDDQPGRERFAVVLTKKRVDDATLRGFVRTNARDRDVWVTPFEFPKEARR